ncbi:MAG: ABC-2 family transporter protein, partial [Alicyclobacillus shizuokensis]|nr:ABC-2 family transporter protein [Alicyclobacillus shizuokensis]
MSKVGNRLQLALAYFVFNVKGSYAFRASFWLEVVSMVFNDAIWVTFWLLYFARFPVVGGWHRTDILYLWGLSAVSFGIMDIMFGNALNLGRIISEGELDIYLSHPKPPLYHALISRQNVVGWGDLSFGVMMLVLSTPHTGQAVIQTLVALAACTLLLIGFVVLTQSLVFFIGGREGLGAQLAEVFI